MIVTTADDVDLWWEREGDGPAVLLIPGRGDASDLFPHEFSAALVAGGLSVLRWDPRDTGLSGDGGDECTVATMAEDAISVLDGAGVAQAQVVGISMAGLVMAHLVSRHAERVRALTFVAAMSPDPDAGMGEDFFGALEVGESDRVGALVQAMGETTESDRVWAAALVESGDRRAAYRPDAVDRHQAAAFRFDWPTIDALEGVRAPTLVVHGRQDRILPVAHAEALHAVVEGSTLSIVDDMGHIPRLADWLTIAAAIVALDPATTEDQAPT